MIYSLVEALNGPSAAALAAAAAATAAPSPLPMSMNMHAASSSSASNHGRRHRSKKPRSTNNSAGNPTSTGIGSSSGPLAQLSTRITDLDSYIENDLSTRTELNNHDSNLRYVSY